VGGAINFLLSDLTWGCVKVLEGYRSPHEISINFFEKRGTGTPVGGFGRVDQEELSQTKKKGKGKGSMAFHHHHDLRNVHVKNEPLPEKHNLRKVRPVFLKGPYKVCQKKRTVRQVREHHYRESLLKMSREKKTNNLDRNEVSHIN